VSRKSKELRSLERDLESIKRKLKHHGVSDIEEEEAVRDIIDEIEELGSLISDTGSVFERIESFVKNKPWQSLAAGICIIAALLPSRKGR